MPSKCRRASTGRAWQLDTSDYRVTFMDTSVPKGTGGCIVPGAWPMDLLAAYLAHNPSRAELETHTHVGASPPLGIHRELCWEAVVAVKEQEGERRTVRCCPWRCARDTGWCCPSGSRSLRPLVRCGRSDWGRRRATTGSGTGQSGRDSGLCQRPSWRCWGGSNRTNTADSQTDTVDEGQTEGARRIRLKTVFNTSPPAGYAAFRRLTASAAARRLASIVSSSIVS